VSLEHVLIEARVPKPVRDAIYQKINTLKEQNHVLGEELNKAEELEKYLIRH
jgi:hypothetical protein